MNSTLLVSPENTSKKYSQGNHTTYCRGYGKPFSRDFAVAWWWMWNFMEPEAKMEIPV